MIEIGNSLVEEDKLDIAKALLEKSNGKLILPGAKGHPQPQKEYQAQSCFNGNCKF